MTPQDSNVAGLLDGIRNGERRALAKSISLIENNASGIENLLAGLHPDTGRAQRIGFTGPPGAGKSTLVHAVIKEFRDRGQTVGVIAVDPSSPLTGGALLGDRIRMEGLTLDPGVFIRSMAARGATGGLALATQEATDLLDAFGFDVVLVETVGVGQSELSITGAADTTVLVLVPESGDEVQVLKAGIMEVADIFVVNKSDRPDARLLVRELVEHWRMRSDNRTDSDVEWEKPVLATVATTGEGVTELVDAFEVRGRHLAETGEGQRRRRERLARHVRELTDRFVQKFLWSNQGIGEQYLQSHLDDMASGRSNAYQVSREIVRRFSAVPES